MIPRLASTIPRTTSSINAVPSPNHTKARTDNLTTAWSTKAGPPLIDITARISAFIDDSRQQAYSDISTTLEPYGERVKNEAIVNIEAKIQDAAEDLASCLRERNGIPTGPIHSKIISRLSPLTQTSIGTFNQLSVWECENSSGEVILSNIYPEDRTPPWEVFFDGSVSKQWSRTQIPALQSCIRGAAVPSRARDR